MKMKALLLVALVLLINQVIWLNFIQELLSLSIKFKFQASAAKQSAKQKYSKQAIADEDGPPCGYRIIKVIYGLRNLGGNLWPQSVSAPGKLLRISWSDFDGRFCCVPRGTEGHHASRRRRPRIRPSSWTIQESQKGREISQNQGNM